MPAPGSFPSASLVRTAKPFAGANFMRVFFFQVVLVEGPCELSALAGNREGVLFACAGRPECVV
jgi:hypothetical protein